MFRIFGQVINGVGNIAGFSHKYGKGFGRRATHPYPIFLGVNPWISFLRSAFSRPEFSRSAVCGLHFFRSAVCGLHFHGLGF